MENEDTKKDSPDAANEMLPAAAKKGKTEKKTKARSNTKKAGTQKAKTFHQYWKTAEPLRKLEITFAAALVAVGIGTVAVYVWGNMQTRWNFRAEHRPRIVFGAFKIADTVTQRYELNKGHPFFVEIPYQNTGRSTAYHVYVHRHVLFGSQYSGLKIEPPDTATSQRLDPGMPVVTDAVSVQDTYKVESIYVAPDSFREWDGTMPIVAFGRITYQDSDGTLYCTPFGAAYLNDQTFNVLSDFPSQNISVSDLCPSGSIQ